MKKTLLISNNCLSNVNNNGKTLKSIFNKLINEKRICSLYFSYEKNEIDIPTMNINEKKILHFKEKRTKIVPVNTGYSNLKRLLREIIWLIPSWKRSTYKFVEKNEIGVIFFLAGDSVFSYRITLKLKKKYNLMLLVYYTDDYFFRNYNGFFGHFRKKIVNYYIEKIIALCEGLYVISPKMKDKYQNHFHKKCGVLGISNEDLYNHNIKKENKNRKVFTYIGNLGIGRYEVIVKFVEEVANINKLQKTDYLVQIYTNSILTEEEKKVFRKYKNVIFGSGLSEKQVNKKLIETDYLIFIESFLEEMIEITKFSFSTKIMEYLSVKKLIISIGPKNISSMEILSNCSISFNNNYYTANELYLALKNDKRNKVYLENTEKTYNCINSHFKKSKKEILNRIYEACS